MVRRVTRVHGSSVVGVILFHVAHGTMGLGCALWVAFCRQARAHARVCVCVFEGTVMRRVACTVCGAIAVGVPRVCLVVLGGWCGAGVGVGRDVGKRAGGVDGAVVICDTAWLPRWTTSSHGATCAHLPVPSAGLGCLKL